jgi:AraC-like DNA-binding protein
MKTRNLISRQEAGETKYAREALAEMIARWTVDKGQADTPIPDLILRRWESPTHSTSYLHEPSICLIAQGAKRVLLGDEIYIYDTQHFLIASLNLPIMAEVIEASRQKPYLGLMLKLDRRAIAQLMVDSNLPSPRIQESSRGLAVGQVTVPLLNAFQRLIDLLYQPEDIPVLAPLIQREILYRLLVGEQGPRLRQTVAAGSQSHQIARSIDWLKDNFARQFKIDDLAAQASMSASTFHHHFRALTAMSPLQFQKRLRLHEARRLMLSDHLDASTAAFQVGYESPSQFNREYNRMFGAPPLRDISGLRQMAVREGDANYQALAQVNSGEALQG